MLIPAPFTDASAVYVFALLHHRDQPTVDPTDLSQWTFFVLPTRILDAERPAQKTIRLNPLRSLGAVETDFAGLREAVAHAVRPSNGSAFAGRSVRSSSSP